MDRGVVCLHWTRQHGDEVLPQPTSVYHNTLDNSSIFPQMASLVRWAKTAFRLAPLTPLRVPSGGFDVIAPSEVLEEERFPEFKAGVYCPVTIGGVVVSKYQVVGQLGFGVLSTVWLARDLENHSYGKLKVYARESSSKTEYATYQHLTKDAKRWH